MSVKVGSVAGLHRVGVLVLDNRSLVRQGLLKIVLHVSHEELLRLGRITHVLNVETTSTSLTSGHGVHKVWPFIHLRARASWDDSLVCSYCEWTVELIQILVTHLVKGLLELLTLLFVSDFVFVLKANDQEGVVCIMRDSSLS